MIIAFRLSLKWTQHFRFLSLGMEVYFYVTQTVTFISISVKKESEFNFSMAYLLHLQTGKVARVLH